MPYVETPPADLSGGFLIFDYTDGTRLHHQRIHIWPFNSAPIATPFNYPFAAGAGAPGDAGVLNTAQAWIGEMQQYFSGGWVIGLARLYQVVAGVATEVFPAPVATPLAGTGGAAVAGWLPEDFTQLNFKSAGGNHGKIVIYGDQEMASQVPVQVATGAGGILGVTVTYLCGAATGLRCHDGTKFVSPSHVTFGYNRRLRRHYGHA